MARNKAFFLALLFLALAAFCWAQDDAGSVKNLQGAAWFLGDDEAESVLLLGRLDDKNYIATIYIRTVSRYTEEGLASWTIDDWDAFGEGVLEKDGHFYSLDERYVADAQVTIKGNKIVFNGKKGNRITNLYPVTAGSVDLFSYDCLGFDLTLKDGKVAGDTISVTVEGKVEFVDWDFNWNSELEYKHFAKYKQFEKRRINFKRFYP